MFAPTAPPRDLFERSFICYIDPTTGSLTSTCESLGVSIYYSVLDMLGRSYIALALRGSFSGEWLIEGGFEILIGDM
jgi:hypothetical protein